MLEEQEKKKRSGLRLVSRKSTKKMLGRWKKLESVDKSDTESQKDVEPCQSMRIMGLSLTNAVELNPSLDGIPLPSFFRISIDYVESNGICLEGIYRVSSPKSRLDELERLTNECGKLNFHDAHEAAGLIKRFIRQLPDALLPADAERLAEQCSCDWKGVCRCGISRQLKQLLMGTDRPNYYLVAYMCLHAQRVISREVDNKMGLPALGLLLQTVMDMSRKLVCLLIQNATPLLSSDSQACYLFDDIRITPYVLPRTPTEVEEWRCEDKPLIEDELNKQNNLLALLHRQISTSLEVGNDASGLEGELWAVQTAITALKRRVKAVAEPTPSSANGRPEDRPCTEMFEEKQLMAVQSQLRDDTTNERRRIAGLLWAIENIVGLETAAHQDFEITKEEDEWREKCGLEEAARAALVAEVGRLRNECAQLRAKIEMYTHAQLASTRF